MDSPVESSKPVISPEEPPEEQVSEQAGEPPVEQKVEAITLFNTWTDRYCSQPTPFPSKQVLLWNGFLNRSKRSIPAEMKGENPSLYLRYDDNFDTRVDVELEYAKSIGDTSLSLAYLTSDGDEQMQELVGSLSSIHGILYHDESDSQGHSSVPVVRAVQGGVFNGILPYQEAISGEQTFVRLYDLCDERTGKCSADRTDRNSTENRC